VHEIGGLRPLRRFAALAVVAGVILAACVGSALVGPTPESRGLEGTSWRAVTIRDAAPIAGAEPTIHFDGDQAGGTTGCNTYGGAFHLDPDGTFLIGPMMMTEIACTGGRGAQEGVVVDLLSHAGHLEFLGGGRIRISGTAGAIEFEEVPG